MTEEKKKEETFGPNFGPISEPLKNIPWDKVKEYCESLGIDYEEMMEKAMGNMEAWIKQWKAPKDEEKEDGADT